MVGLDADEPVLLLDLVECHPRHAERKAPRVGGHVNAGGPAAARGIQVLARGEPEHGDRGEAPALVAAREDDRVVARHRRELGEADGNGV